MNGFNNLPNLILGGPGRTGTTSLFEYLLQHRKICGSQEKETNYFLSPLFNQPLASLDAYAKLFERCRGREYRYIVESTPAYFLGGRKIAEAMKGTLGPVRVVFTLRDPVERFLSGYWHIKSKVLPGRAVTHQQYLEQSKNVFIESLRRYEDLHYAILIEGRYADYLEQWYDTIGPESIYIMFYENLLSDMDDTLRSLLKWLELEADEKMAFPYTNKSISIRSSSFQKLAAILNRAGEHFLRKNQRIKNIMGSLYYLLNAKTAKEKCPYEVRKFLEDHYKPSTKRLSALLKKNGIGKLPKWVANA